MWNLIDFGVLVWILLILVWILDSIDSGVESGDTGVDSRDFGMGGVLSGCRGPGFFQVFWVLGS